MEIMSCQSLKRKSLFLSKAFALLVLVLPIIANGQQTLRSSVSPEFRGGLQEKFLSYIAEKMELPLSIYPITYAQRIELLRAGRIDIMVGLKDEHITQGDFIYLKPSYDQLTNNVFVLKKNRNKYKTLTDLRKARIAFTPDNTAIDKEIELLGIDFIPAPYVKQKIELLQKGRVDAFVYFKDSALKKVKAMGLENEIVPANLAPFTTREHFIALSTHSPLMAEKEKLTAIIENGLQNGDFARIRKQHYLNQ